MVKPDSLPPSKIPIGFLVEVTKQYLEKEHGIADFKIEIERLSKCLPDKELQLVRSGVFIGEKYALIRLREGLNPCWQRFCIAKELAHIVLDRKFGAEHRFRIDQVDEVVNAVVYTNIFSNVWKQIPIMKWEKIGRDFATRLLVPSEYRNLISKQISDDDLDASVLKWAETLKVPAKALDAYLHPKEG